jgi:hypothetical protein
MIAWKSGSHRLKELDIVITADYCRLALKRVVEPVRRDYLCSALLGAVRIRVSVSQGTRMRKLKQERNKTMYTQPKVVSVVDAGSSIMSQNQAKGEGAFDSPPQETGSAYEADE